METITETLHEMMHEKLLDLAEKPRNNFWGVVMDNNSFEKLAKEDSSFRNLRMKEDGVFVFENIKIFRSEDVKDYGGSYNGMYMFPLRSE